MKKEKLLLHICCAPDATVPWPALAGEGYDAVGFFYGSNIHPEEEYQNRADAVRHLAAEEGGSVFFDSYEPPEWLEAVRGLENEPERGRRCARCFEEQLSAAAAYAAENGFTHLCTTLTISPHKDADLINETGARAAARHGLVWVEKIWRKKDGFKRSVTRSKELGLYRQNYCGCVFSSGGAAHGTEMSKMTEPNEKKIPSGKLSPEALKRNVLSYRGADRPGLLIGPGVGEDAAVIKWPEGKYMIFASDPVVGAEKGAGRLLVRINSNDIASKGGDPEYLAVTLVLPPSFGEEGAARIMREIDEECRAQGIAVAGGHTEFNDRYDRPVIMGALVGSADMVMRASDISEGDVIIVTKHIGIEGMSIVAADRPELLSPFMSEDEISEILSWADMTSVLPEARILRKYARFMHDPTEGGFCGGLDEICMLCGLSAQIDRNALPIKELTARAAEHLCFDPLHLIASGSLLAVVPKELAGQALSDLKVAGIAAASVGSMGSPLSAAVPEPKEELWRLLKMGKENGE